MRRFAVGPVLGGPSLVLALVTCCPAPAAPQGLQAAWSKPEVLFTAQRGLSLRAPSSAVHAGEVVVAANLFPLDTSGAVPPRPLVIVTTSGRSIAPPPGDYSFTFPKILIDESGVYHLLWAESPLPTTSAFDWPGRPLTSLWYARYENGRWSEPKGILRSTRLWWRTDGGTAVVDRKGLVHLVVLATPESGNQPGLAVLNGGETWEMRFIPNVLPGFASIARTGHDSLLVAFTAPDRSVPSDGSSVFVAVSPDAGASWSKPQLVSRSGRTPASKPLALADARGAMAVLWIQARNDSSPVLRLVTSHNGPWQWTPAADSPIEGEVLGIAAFMDGCGTTAIISELPISIRPILAQTSWWRGRAKRSEVATDGPGAFPAAAVDGSAHLIWVGPSQGGGGRLLHAQRPSICAAISERRRR